MANLVVMIVMTATPLTRLGFSLAVVRRSGIPSSYPD